MTISREILFLQSQEASEQEREYKLFFHAKCKTFSQMNNGFYVNGFEEFLKTLMINSC